MGASGKEHSDEGYVRHLLIDPVKNAGVLLTTAAGFGKIDVVRRLMVLYSYTSKDLVWALTWACNEGQARAVEELLRCGVEPNEHAMWSACLHGHAEIVSQLLAAGLSMTPYCADVATRYGHDKVLGLVRDSA